MMTHFIEGFVIIQKTEDEYFFIDGQTLLFQDIIGKKDISWTQSTSEPLLRISDVFF